MALAYRGRHAYILAMHKYQTKGYLISRDFRVTRFGIHAALSHPFLLPAAGSHCIFSFSVDFTFNVVILLKLKSEPGLQP